jgi:hypothetical protein
MNSARSHELGVSDALMQLIYEGLGHGLRIGETGDPIAPFLLVETLDEIVAVALDGDSAEQCILAGRRSIAHGCDERQVLIYGGQLKSDAEDQDSVPAVHAEAYERSQGIGHRFAQRYRFEAAGRPVEPLGRPIYLHAILLGPYGEVE